MFVNGFVNLYTADIEAGLRFYRDLLGFEETFRTPKKGTPEHVELTSAASHWVSEPPQRQARPRGRCVARYSGDVVVVWADDVDAAFERLQSAGVSVLQPPHDTGDDNRNALLRDPDGNLVEIVGKVA